MGTGSAKKINSKQKGNRFERLIANALAVIWGGAKRAIQARSGGEACDVEGTDYFVECKFYKKIGLFRWWGKAVADRAAAGDNREIALAMTENGTSQVLVCITLEEFIRLQRLSTGRTLREAALPMDCKLVFEGRYQIGSIEKEQGGFRATHSETYRDQQRGEPETKMTPCPNPAKNSDGLWSTLDSAEAAVRRCADD